MRALLGLGVVMLMGITAAGEGAELDAIRWHTNLNDAWQECQTQQRPLLVYVTRENCTSVLR